MRQKVNFSPTRASGSVIFVSLDAIDVTETLVVTLDERIGDGEGAVPLPDPPPSAEAP